MDKICPRCKRSFVCQNDNILECWCVTEQISTSVRQYLAQNFKGCLCQDCIQIINKSLILNYQPQIIIENEKS
jgi:hypothetical protein